MSALDRDDVKAQALFVAEEAGLMAVDKVVAKVGGVSMSSMSVAGPRYLMAHLAANSSSDRSSRSAMILLRSDSVPVMS